MNNILINVNVTPNRFDDFCLGILPIMNLDNPQIFMKVTLIGDIPIGTFYRDYPRLELHQIYVEPPSYLKITNRQGRLGSMMDYRFTEKFSSIFLMDDDMEINDSILFIDSLIQMDKLINKYNLSFLKTTTNPDPKIQLKSKIGWPWMSNGIMIKWFNLKCPDNLIDKWFFLEDFIIMKLSANINGYRFAQYNNPIGVIHHTDINTHEKGFEVDPEVCEFLSDGIFSYNKFDKTFMSIYSEYLNSLNKFKLCM